METEINDEKVLFVKNSRWLRIVLVAFFLLIGLGVRLVDLSNPPLDFAATRQLHSLILARGYYYSMDLPSTRSLPVEQRQFGIRAGQEELLVEPPLLEHLTALNLCPGRPGKFRNSTAVFHFLLGTGGYSTLPVGEEIHVSQWCLGSTDFL